MSETRVQNQITFIEILEFLLSNMQIANYTFVKTFQKAMALPLEAAIMIQIPYCYY